MDMRARDSVVPALVALLAWAVLSTWAPSLRYFTYAFILGSVASLGSFGIFLLFSSRSKLSWPEAGKLPSARPLFTTPAAWQTETTNLQRQYLYKQETIYPPSFAVSQSLDGFLDLIIRDFLSSWYNRISKSGGFENEIDRAIRTAVVEIRKRIFERDIVEAVVSRIVPLITRHLKEFYEAERAVRGIHLNRTVTESEELDLAIAAKYRDGNLHPAASLKYADLKIVQQDHLRRAVVRVLPQLLPEEIVKSRAVSILIKEIISCAVLAPLMQMLCDPDSWNQVLESYGRAMVQDRKTVRKLRAALDQHASPPPKPSKTSNLLKLNPGDDERKFERFVRSIRGCTSLSEARRFRRELSTQLTRESSKESRDQIYVRRLENGKHLLDQRIAKLSAVGNASNGGPNLAVTRQSAEIEPPNLINASLRQVLYDASGLSYFMEFMDRRQRMTLVQFWIVVDGLRNPLEDESHADDAFANAQQSWSEADRMDLMQINEAYLSKEELDIPVEAKQAVNRFLKLGNDASMSDFGKARSSVLQAQASAFREMNNDHFPAFKKSDLFYKYLTADESIPKAPIKQAARASKPPTMTPVPESPSRLPLMRSGSSFAASGPKLKRNAASSSDLKFSARTHESGQQSRRSLDADGFRPLFDDMEDDNLARSTNSLGQGSQNDEQSQENQDQVVNAMEAALTDIISSDGKYEDTRTSSVDGSESQIFGTHIDDFASSSGEFRRMDAIPNIEKERALGGKPNLASLGLVNTSSRIGVFTDNDLFGDEEKFLEDEQTDPDYSADEKSVDDEIHQAAPGDLGLTEAITALTSDIDKLAAQESVLDTLTRKAELTNNVAELRILGKSKSSLEREIRRKELQRQQYIVQESDNSLYGRADISIKSIMVGREPDGQEFALYVIEVVRQAGDNLPAASWAVARRYSEFHDLHRRLRHRYPSVRNIDFPRRGLVMKLQREFIHKRRLALEDYLRQLLRLPAVCRGRDLRAFLSQSAIVSQEESTKEGERRDIVSRIYNSVTDGMDEFLGNVPVLDQLSVAGQNLISAATSQFNTVSAAPANNVTGSADAPLPLPPEYAFQSDEARAELLVFEPNSNNSGRADQLEPFVKPICDLFLETFDLQRGNNWLRGRAVVVVLHQLLGGTVERKVRETVRNLFADAALLKNLDMIKDLMWPDGQLRKERPVRKASEKARSKMEASVTLTTLIPDLAGNVVGRANAQAASRRLAATFNNERLNTHLIFSIIDESIDILFPRG